MIFAMLVALSACLPAAWLTRQLSRPGFRLYLLDHPNERSLHSAPTPRGGGLGVLLGVAVAGGMVAWRYGISATALWSVAAMTLLAIVSYLDDRYTLPAGARLLAHIASSGMLVLGGLAMNGFTLPGVAWHWGPWVGAALTVPFVVWMINLYNFMDGMDGFAGGMAVIGFAAFAALGGLHGSAVFAWLSLAVSMAAAGFLIFNFPPARIFLGDVGSAPLGLMAAGFSLWGVREEVFPLWVALLIFSPFVVDATITLLRRVVTGERIWEAHRTHCYQRLVQAGWGHRKTLMLEYAMMLGCAGTGLWIGRQSAPVQWAVLVAWAGLYGGLFWMSGRIQREQGRGAS
jgi:UDP-N-acetylmuramyl pentapeptide phosphotransferase/UDP-N-acetylglucosamine-1-phosphate transferase